MTSVVHNYTPGTLVEARRRLWRVDAQDRAVLHATAVDDTQVQAKVFLTFEAVKPGQLQPPDPSTVGYPQAQELMLRAFRLLMTHSTAPFLALHRSRVLPVSYQLVPVVLALQQTRVRLLIADDVGLGKTIEGGLVISKLIARGQARRVLVICPASLREQWQDALKRFFHIEAQLFSHQHRRDALEKRLAGLSEADAGLSTEIARANVLDHDAGETDDQNEGGNRAERVLLGTAASYPIPDRLR